MSGTKNNEIVSVGAWLGIFILLAIPLINIIAALYLTFGSKNKTLNNFGIASLIIMLISLVLLALNHL